EAAVNRLNHGNGVFGEIRWRLFFKKRSAVAVDSICDVTGFGLQPGVGFIGGLTDFGLNIGAQFVHFVARHDVVFQKITFRLRNRIALAGARQLIFTAILGLIVGG